MQTQYKVIRIDLNAAQAYEGPSYTIWLVEKNGGSLERLLVSPEDAETFRVGATVMYLAKAGASK